MTALANYYQCLKDTDGEMKFANIGAGIGGGFENTMELKPMKYNEAINGPDGKDREKEIENEHDRMVKNNAWESVKKILLPKGTKVIDSTWVCKKRALESYASDSMHADSNKLKKCTTTEQVPMHLSQMPAPSESY
jgi:hypothetical protein